MEEAMKTEASTALLCFEALGMRSFALNVIHCTVETMNDSQGQRSCSIVSAATQIP
jgi:hypothetical protein